MSRICELATGVCMELDVLIVKVRDAPKLNYLNAKTIYSPQSEAYSERLNSMLCSQLLHFVFLSFPLVPNGRDIVSSNGMVDNIEEVDNEELITA